MQYADAVTEYPWRVYEFGFQIYVNPLKCQCEAST